MKVRRSRFYSSQSGFFNGLRRKKLKKSSRANQFSSSAAILAPSRRLDPELQETAGD
jgi:hypothetical protein